MKTMQNFILKLYFYISYLKFGVSDIVKVWCVVIYFLVHKDRIKTVIQILRHISCFIHKSGLSCSFLPSGLAFGALKWIINRESIGALIGLAHSAITRKLAPEGWRSQGCSGSSYSSRRETPRALPWGQHTTEIRRQSILLGPQAAYLHCSSVPEDKLPMVRIYNMDPGGLARNR